MKKSTLFIVFLLLIMTAEIIMLIKHGIAGGANEYALDTKVYDMPRRENELKLVRPTSFDIHAADELDAILDDFAADITKSVAKTPSIVANDGVVNEADEEGKIEEEYPAINDNEVITDNSVSEVEADNEGTANKDVVIVIEDEAPVTESNLYDDKSEDSLKVDNIDEPIVLINDVVPEEELPIAEEQQTKEEIAVNNVATVEKKYKIAVVIDDIGLSVPFTKEIAQIKAPLTVSFLPYGASNKEQVEALKAAGFEVMLHVPMMPHVPAALAPITLSPEMDKVETQKELNKMIDRFAGTGIYGVNNHMGSLLTERVKNMGYVMDVLKNRGLFFLDSKTTSKSVAKKVADEYGVSYIARDVFLDNKNDYDYILGQFREAEKIAKKNGFAVAIGHPHSQTLKALNDWLKEAESKDFEIVHLSDLLVK